MRYFICEKEKQAGQKCGQKQAKKKASDKINLKWCNCCFDVPIEHLDPEKLQLSMQSKNSIKNRNIYYPCRLCHGEFRKYRNPNIIGADGAQGYCKNCFQDNKNQAKIDNVEDLDNPPEIRGD